MSEVQKPIVPVEAAAPAVEPTPATTEAAPAAEPTTETAAPTTEAKTEEAAKEETPKEEVKPIYEGKLSYNPGSNPLSALFGLKKEYVFFFGEEAVPTDKLAHLLKSGKTELKETVAWSAETGKGLLYFAKHADQKDSPKGVIALADVEDVKTAGPLELTFKAHGHKHALIAESHAALKGWELALKEKIEEAKTLKDEVVAKSGYKETLEKLSKPAVVAAVAAKTETAPKKSSDSKSVERAARSSEATDKARPSIKERSQSRSKKLIAQLRGKKEAAKEDVKGEESAEVPAAETAPVEATETPAVVAAAPAVEESAPADTAAPVETEEKDVKETKQGRRSSKFFDKIRTFGASSASEKKPEEASEAKDAEVPAVAETAPTVDTPAIVEPAKATEPVITAPEPAVEETPATNGDKVEEAASPTTAAKEEKRRSSFFSGSLAGFAGSLRKTSASGEKKPKLAKEEKTAEEVKPEEPAVEEAKAVEEPKPEEAIEETPAAETAPEVPAKDAEVKKEKKENKFIGGIQRSLSKLRKDPKEKKVKPTTEKLDEEKPTEEVKATEAAPGETAKEVEPEKEETAAPSQNVIGDVVAEAVHTGAPPASQTVSTKA